MGRRLKIETLIINQKQVPNLISMKECIQLMETTLKELSLGNALQPLRTVIPIEEKKVIGLMPSYLKNLNICGIKSLTVFSDNHGTKYDAHQGVILLHSATNGYLKAIVDATSITGIRTAAASGVATDILSNKDASELAILGAGTQAYAHIEAMLLVRNIKSITVWTPFREECQAFAKKVTDSFGVITSAPKTAAEAVKSADIICTTTPSRNPILMGRWVKKGAHINAIGACSPDTRELDSDLVASSKVFVDRIESTLNESGDLLIPIKEGLIGENHILGEIGNILTQKIAGRTSKNEITLFKGLGLAIEDLATANFVYEKALQTNTGISTYIGGERFLNKEE